MSSGMVSKDMQAMIVAYPVNDHQMQNINNKLFSLQSYSQSYNGGVNFKVYTSVDPLSRAIVENMNEQ